MWQSLLYPPIFTQIIDIALGFLFDFKSHNISYAQKLAAYAHLYSYASVKSVVHWFQIMRESTFQMYDDDLGSVWSVLQTHAQSRLTSRTASKSDSSTPTEVSVSLPISDQEESADGLDGLQSESARFLSARHTPRLPTNTRTRSYRPVRFPTQNITTPIVLVYGTADSLVDIDSMLIELPEHSTTVVTLDGYEHLDVLWGSNIHVDVIPEVVGALQYWCNEHRGRGEDEQSTGSKEGVKVSHRPSSSRECMAQS